MEEFIYVKYYLQNPHGSNRDDKNRYVVCRQAQVSRVRKRARDAGQSAIGKHEAIGRNKERERGTIPKAELL